jgi:copper chaperone CopZ
VYYAQRAGASFAKSQLRVPVGIKEKAGDRPLCYCFGHSVATIEQELRTKGRSDALEDIRRKMQDPGCACEVKNPSASCCLGTVRKGIEAAQPEARSILSGSRAETISKVGTVLSAIMASSCCWLPLALLAFGMSGAGIAGALDAYRPLFIVSTATCLAAAFFFTYRPCGTPSVSKDCCSTAKCCCAAPTDRRRFGVMTLNKVMLWGVAILAIAFLFFPSYVKFFLTGRGTDTPAANNPLVRTTTFAVKGMTCEACATLVVQAVKDIPGVLSVQVDYDKKRLVVSTEECCPAPVETVMQALEKAGYRGEVIADSPPQAGQ